jgi:hypothetical protein
MWGFDIRLRKRDLLGAAAIMYLPTMAVGAVLGYWFAQ